MKCHRTSTEACTDAPPLRLAVVGATGRVGQEILRRLEEREWPIDELRLFATERSVGSSLEAFGRRHEVRVLGPGAFDGLDLVLSSTPDEAAESVVALARDAGVVVIDESARWRMDPAAALVIPEINGHRIQPETKLYASPNCAVTQIAMALAPLHRRWPLREVVITTLQSASGAGWQGERELLDQVRRPHAERGETSGRVFDEGLAFNALPRIGRLDEHGISSEESKIAAELRRLLDADALEVAVQTVRVPVRVGHGASVYLRTHRNVAKSELLRALRDFDGLTLLDDGRQLPTPRRAAGQDAVLVGRVRGERNRWQLFCSADNLRKGAATNAVQIAEGYLGRVGRLAAPRVHCVCQLRNG